MPLETSITAGQPTFLCRPTLVYALTRPLYTDSFVSHWRSPLPTTRTRSHEHSVRVKHCMHSRKGQVPSFPNLSKDLFSATSFRDLEQTRDQEAKHTHNTRNKQTPEQPTKPTQQHPHPKCGAAARAVQLAAAEAHALAVATLHADTALPSTASADTQTVNRLAGCEAVEQTATG